MMAPMMAPASGKKRMASASGGKSSVRTKGIGRRVRKCNAAMVSAKGLIFHVVSLGGEDMSFMLH
jgi:hypothetical protein